ncbi:FMN-binding protein [Candidatus Margulisiibacteriota bacterium]
MKDMMKLGGFLFIAAAIAAGALSLTYIITAPKIEAQKQLEISSALTADCLPGACDIKERKLGTHTYYIGHDKKGGISGYAFRVAPKGYGGPIDMIVGISMNGQVSGITIISMAETPGLGSQANKPAFLNQFLGKNSKAKLKAKQDIDSISGATVTSQAVCDGVKEALQLFTNI